MSKSKNPSVQIVKVLLLSLLIFFLSGISSEFLTKFTHFSEVVEDEYFQIFLLLFSIVFSLLFSKGMLSHYGFKIPIKGYYFKIALIILAIETISSICLSFITIDGAAHFASNYTFFRTVLSIWIIASVSEEVFTRGFVQSYLHDFTDKGITIFRIFISLPVIVGACVFMAIHIPLIMEGIDHVLYILILLSTFTLGIVAGYFREKTGSLLPAIFAHMCANIFPMGIEWLMK